MCTNGIVYITTKNILLLCLQFSPFTPLFAINNNSGVIFMLLLWFFSLLWQWWRVDRAAPKLWHQRVLLAWRIWGNAPRLGIRWTQCKKHLVTKDVSNLFCRRVTKMVYDWIDSAVVFPKTNTVIHLKKRFGIGIPITNLRPLSGRLRFIMGITIPIRRRLFNDWKTQAISAENRRT